MHEMLHISQQLQTLQWGCKTSWLHPNSLKTKNTSSNNNRNKIL